MNHFVNTNLFRTAALSILLASTFSSGVIKAETTSQNTQDTEASQQDANAYPSVAASAAFSQEFQSKLASNSNSHTEQMQEAQVAPLTRDVTYHVRGLMQDLMANLEYVDDKTPIAVSSFVILDGNYKETNLLGKQISESFIHEVHKFGIPIIDFKATGDIQVTEQGDFFFSKNPDDLKGNLPIRYVLGGTITSQNGGYLINARIIGVSSRAVVASAQGFIPAEASNAILKYQSSQQSRNVKITSK